MLNILFSDHKILPRIKMPSGLIHIVQLGCFYAILSKSVSHKRNQFFWHVLHHNCNDTVIRYEFSPPNVYVDSLFPSPTIDISTVDKILILKKTLQSQFKFLTFLRAKLFKASFWRWLGLWKSQRETLFYLPVHPVLKIVRKFCQSRVRVCRNFLTFHRIRGRTTRREAFHQEVVMLTKSSSVFVHHQLFVSPFVPPHEIVSCHLNLQLWRPNSTFIATAVKLVCM